MGTEMVPSEVLFFSSRVKPLCPRTVLLQPADVSISNQQFFLARSENVRLKSINS